MSRMNKKAVLRVSADGDIIKCAKGLAAGDCGWKQGDKVCGACGAMAVMTKGMPPKKGMPMGAPMDDEEDEETPVAAGRRPSRPGPRAAAVMGAVADTDMEVVPDEDADMEAEMSDEMDDEMDDDMSGEMEDELPESEDTEEELKRQAKIKKYRKMRLGGMGVKDARGDESSFLCGMSRKMLAGGSEPCEGCSGGCFPVKGMPDLLAIEGMAMARFGGKVLDSGYSSQYDTFVVDVRRKDGRLIEAYYNGSGRSEGWHPIPEDSVGATDNIVGGDEAIVAALSQVEGKALDLGVQVVDGKPAYRVEVDGADGYSYDVFVGMDGKVLGLDQWEYETKSDDITASLMEFQALATEAELRDSGLI